MTSGWLGIGFGCKFRVVEGSGRVGSCLCCPLRNPANPWEKKTSGPKKEPPAPSTCGPPSQNISRRFLALGAKPSEKNEKSLAPPPSPAGRTPDASRRARPGLDHQPHRGLPEHCGAELLRQQRRDLRGAGAGLSRAARSASTGRRVARGGVVRGRRGAKPVVVVFFCFTCFFVGRTFLRRASSPFKKGVLPSLLEKGSTDGREG